MASSLTLSLLLLFSTVVSAVKSPLDPDQTKALHSLNLPTKSDPCSNPSLLCDSSSPFRHVISLTLSNCSSSLSVSSKSLSSLYPTLTSLTLSSCRAKKLTGVFLGRFHNLTSLTVVDSPVKASGPTVILTNMKVLETLTISGANLTGRLPKQWRSTNITKINLSNNQLNGSITDSITALESLESLDLSSNGLDGEIPATIGDMVSLKNLSLSSNSISGTVPDTLPKGLAHLDLGSNQLNGTIPRSISHMKSLKYLNLEKNNFKGVMPFNASFINSLVVFKIGENSNLCYNHTALSTKLKLGIAACDKHGLPLSPPPPKDDVGSGDGVDGDYGSGNDESDKKSSKSSSSHGPNKVVLGVAIGLSAVVFLIIFCVLISKCCCR